MASYLVDLGNTTQMTPSVVPANVFPASGAVIGNVVDLIGANALCNLFVATALTQSGQLRVAVQTSDSTTSGSFTDPTSGLPTGALPTGISSGGIFTLNGGLGLASGSFVAAGFQRPHRYARCNFLSGDFFQAVAGAGFISQLKTTGSGAGFTYNPTSGTVNV